MIFIDLKESSQGKDVSDSESTLLKDTPHSTFNLPNVYRNHA